MRESVLRSTFKLTCLDNVLQLYPVKLFKIGLREVVSVFRDLLLNNLPLYVVNTMMLIKLPTATNKVLTDRK